MFLRFFFLESRCVLLFLKVLSLRILSLCLCITLILPSSQLFLVEEINCNCDVNDCDEESEHNAGDNRPNARGDLGGACAHSVVNRVQDWEVVGVVAEHALGEQGRVSPEA